MNRDSQKWYDKPFSKLILITIALTWIFPVFGFVLSSFRPGESIKRTTWWDAVASGEVWSELTLQNYSEIDQVAGESPVINLINSIILLSLINYYIHIKTFVN